MSATRQLAHMAQALTAKLSETQKALGTIRLMNGHTVKK